MSDRPPTVSPETGLQWPKRNQPASFAPSASRSTAAVAARRDDDPAPSQTIHMPATRRAVCWPKALSSVASWARTRSLSGGRAWRRRIIGGGGATIRRGCRRPRPDSKFLFGYGAAQPIGGLILSTCWMLDARLPHADHRAISGSRLITPLKVEFASCTCSGIIDPFSAIGLLRQNRVISVPTATK